MIPAPTNKRIGHQLYEAGLLGNRFRTFPTAEEALAALAPDAMAGIRYKRAGSPFARIPIRAREIPRYVDELLSLGARLELMQFCEGADDSLLIAQGEVQRSPTGGWMRYSTAPVTMRAAMARDDVQHVSGHAVWRMLEHWFTPSSYADLQALLEFLPNAVVEWSAFRQNVGMLPYRNTIVWEARYY